ARAQGRQRNAPYTVGIATEVCARTRGKAGNVAATGQAHCLGLRRAQAKDDVAVVEELGRSYRWRAAELCQGGAGGKAQEDQGRNSACTVHCSRFLIFPFAMRAGMSLRFCWQDSII